jgi:XTP/dITP diphosphohydrolase
MKLARGQTLVLATHNKGKVVEIGELLAPLGLIVKSAGELGLPEPEETETTFAGNAILKARAAADASGFVAMSDDSGLSVTALDGEPGVYTARWSPGGDNAVGIARIQRELEAKSAKDYSAKFTCALALAAPHGEVDTFEGEVFGHLEFPPRGKNGFGYDPIFVMDGMTQTFGELDPAHKHSISHRARAFAMLLNSGLFQ